MNWQGIPFKYLSTDPVDTVNLALQSIPRIIVDSPTDYTSPIVTGIVSLIAGIIPACIAIWTFKRNAFNTQEQREKQELFLINERAEQQKFLQEERATQIASMEKDRETQLKISKQNFDMQVLSVNRQAWIANLRDLLADYISIAPNLLDYKLKLLNKKKYYQRISELYVESVGEGRNRLRQDYDDAVRDLDDWAQNFDSLALKIRNLEAKIKMMLNPSEIYYREIIVCFANISIVYNEFSEVSLDKYRLKLPEMNDNLDRIMRVSQDLFKYEWERVKQGN